MPDENRLPEEQRQNVNENEDMSDGSSRGLAPTGGGGQGGTYGGGTGDSAAPPDTTGVTNPAAPTAVPPMGA